ncbi:hypothetical protein [Rhizobium sp. BK251]|uniref:hypothetical protein n=1 Tax=Rhizobium sp. BK251 TaxID=2512125 RepID=UPI001042CA35|nr:hypothetical protein [Rhizobium sp. BK251]TCL75485.1 hypothetical protein EV286_10122 [Rhizobium sp. BK251]
MTARRLSEQDAVEFESIGREYDAIETEIKAIIAKKEHLTDEQLASLRALTERQGALHADRLKLLG